MSTDSDPVPSVAVHSRATSEGTQPVVRIRIADAGQHAGETVEIAGWLYNLRRAGKICFPALRDGTGIMQCVAVKSAAAGRAVRSAERSDAGIVADRARQDSRGAARARRLRDGCRKRRDRAARSGIRSLSDHAQGSRRRFPDGSSPSVAAQPAAARGDSACATK